MKTLGLAWILLWATALLSQGQVARGSIDGVVLDSTTGQPIARARVTLYRFRATAPPGIPAYEAVDLYHTEGIPAPATTTDDQGRFSLQDVDPGDYRLTFQSNGYARQDFGQKTFPGYGTPIRVSPGGATRSLTMQLMPTGTVSGQIRNQFGQPAAGVPVRLVQPIYEADGWRRMYAATFTRTNDRGEYRLHYVTPGRYYLGVGNVEFGDGDLGAMVFNSTGSPNETSNIYAPGFFPGVANVDQAEMLGVTSGTEISGLNMRVNRIEYYRVRGRIVDSRTGQPPPRVGFSFNSPPGSPLSSSRSHGDRYDAATGEFDLPMMLPGLRAIIASVPSAPGTFPRQSFTIVNIVDADVNNVLVSISATDHVPLNGQLRLEGNAPGQIPQGMRVTLRPFLDGGKRVNEAMAVHSTAISSDGSFRIDAILRDPQRVALAGLPSGYYVKEAKLGTTDVWGQPLIVEGSTPLVFDILISARLGRVEGAVLDSNGKRVLDGEVVLVPDLGRDRPERFKTGLIGPDGRFQIPDVPPGDYRLFSWETLLPYAFFDPDILRRYEPASKPVRVQESAAAEAEVRMISTSQE